MSTTLPPVTIKCTSCSEMLSPSFLSDHVCGASAGGMAGVGRRAFQQLMLGTPPLSPSFDYGLRTPSPLSPRIATPTSPFPFPYGHTLTPTPLPIPIPNRTVTATPIPTPMSVPVPVSVPVLAQPPTPKLPFLQKYKTNTTVSHSASNPDEEDIGLAYDREDRSEADHDPSRTSISSHSVYSSTTRLTRDFVSSPPPLPPLPPSSPSPASSSPKSPPRRSHTAPTTGPRGGTAGVPSPLGPASPPSLLGTMRSISDAKQRRQRDPQDSFANMQSQVSSPTTPTSPALTGSVVKPRVRICVKCDVRIENGRWIRMDSGNGKGGILCELCWKSMYLPRCRRCSQVIETAAVYSSDGQLKGKYHKHCFTCTTCNAPFPSNTFWIYNGQPMCEYHYHESNHSLCAAKGCRKPIEGDCAITEGDTRYHPGCLICSVGECKERLEEYWEIEGRMVCERHARECEHPYPQSPTRRTPIPDPQPQPQPRRRAPTLPDALRPQKRRTRLITLQSGVAF